MAEVVLQNVYKRYGKVTAVEDFNLHVQDKEFMVFVGPSGCGKSTTLRMIAGLEEISDGTLRIGDKVVNDMPPKDRDIAMVFQNYALYPHMNVYENMAFGLRLRKTPKADIDRRVRDAAKILQIEHLLSRKPKELSGGQRQRVALGRAIVREPKVFLMDEPLSNLDAKLRVEMRSQISQLHRRLATTVIYVTHDQVEAMTMGSRIVVMRDGIIQQVDTPLNLYDYPKTKFVAGFIGSPSMNFLTATVNGGQLDVGGAKLAPEGGLAESLRSYEGKQVWMGIRPEHVGVHGISAEAQGGDVMRGTVVVVEPLGAQTDLIVDVGGQTLTAKVEGHAQLNPGDTVDLVVDRSRLHAFDYQSEAALGRRDADAGPGAGASAGTPAPRSVPAASTRTPEGETITVVPADD